MQSNTGTQGQPLSCGFFCNGIAWFPVKDYHLGSHILTDAYLLSRERELPEHLYTLAPSDSHIGLSIWQPILCPQRAPPPPILPRSKPKKWAVLPSSVLDLSLRNKIQSPSLGGGWGTQRLNIGEVCPREGVCDRNLLIFTGWYNPSPLCI